MEKPIEIIIVKNNNIVCKAKLISNKDINIITKETFPTPIAYEIVIKKRRFCFNFEGSKINEKGSPLNITNNNPKNNLNTINIF